MNENKILWVLQSRKFWSAVVGLVAIVYVAWAKGDTLDPDTIVNAILGIVAAYMGATALEDGMSKQAEANAATTTVSTPSTSDVTVTATDTPPTPTLDRMGG